MKLVWGNLIAHSITVQHAFGINCFNFIFILKKNQ